MRRGQVLGAVLVLVAIALLTLYLVTIPILHYYSWTGIPPPVELEGIVDFIDSYAGILMIPVVLGIIAACGVLCWIGWVSIRTPDGEPDWSGILESDEEL